jgi:uncharacterized protein
MKPESAFYKISHFFLVKMAVGIALVVAAVAFSEFFIGLPLRIATFSDYTKGLIIALADAAMALLAYVLLFRAYEKRRIMELSLSNLGKYGIMGFAIGLILQASFILVILFVGSYTVTQVNPVSYVIPSLAAALTAGFVAELLIIGIFFRLTEEKLGTAITLIITVGIFAIVHARKEDATFLGVCATAVNAGFLLPAAYIYSRSLWLPIFIHFAWDFAEPGIFGANNPGNTISQSLLTSEIKGPTTFTGDSLGPQNSIQSLLLCLAVGVIFLWLAKRKDNLIRPFWKK